MIKIMKIIKNNFKMLKKNITLDQLCGNYYLREDISAIKHIYGMKILERWKHYKIQKNLRKRLNL